MMFLGVDAGSSYIKFALLDDSCAVVALHVYENIGHEFQRIDQRIARFLSVHEKKRGDVLTAACGYGKGYISDPATRITEITALSRGVAAAQRNIDCIVDIGAQDFKVIKIEPLGGRTLQFYMNDGCSSGTGAFIDMMLQKLDIFFYELDDYYYKGTAKAAVSSTCTVFAASEVIGHLMTGESTDSILRGIIDSLVQRIAPLVDRIGSAENFTLTGGLSGCKCVVNAFRDALKLNYVYVDDARYRGAIGAAVYLSEV